MQTSPAPSCSTDTASESGSAFNSPIQVHHQPSSADLANSTYVKDFSRLVVVKMSGKPSEQSMSQIIHVSFFLYKVINKFPNFHFNSRIK